MKWRRRGAAAAPHKKLAERRGVETACKVAHMRRHRSGGGHSHVCWVQALQCAITGSSMGGRRQWASARTVAIRCDGRAAACLRCAGKHVGDSSASPTPAGGRRHGVGRVTACSAAPSQGQLRESQAGAGRQTLDARCPQGRAVGCMGSGTRGANWRHIDAAAAAATSRHAGVPRPRRHDPELQGSNHMRSTLHDT